MDGARRRIVLATAFVAVTLGVLLIVCLPATDLPQTSVPSGDMAGVGVPADAHRSVVLRRASLGDVADSSALACAGTVTVFGHIRTTINCPLRPESALLLGRDHDSLSIRVQEIGTYEVTDVARKEWRLVVYAPGFRVAERLLDLTGVASAARIDVALERCVSLSVSLLTTRDEPLRPLLVARGLGHLRLGVFATIERPSDLPLSVHSGPRLVHGEGRWREDSTRGASDGTLEWDGPMPFHVGVFFNHVLLAARCVSSDVGDVRLRVDVDRLAAALGTIELRLLDSVHGTPVRRALVTVDGSRTVRVNDAGRATLEHVLPGIRAIRIEASRYEAWSRYARVDAGGRADLGDVQMWRREQIAGTVHYRGLPTQAKLTLIPIDASDRAPMESGQLPGHCAEGRTSSEGVFRFEQAGRRRYLLIAHRGHIGREMLRGTKIVDATFGPVRDVRVDLAPTHEVKLQLSRGLKHSILHVVDVSGIVVWSQQWSQEAVDEPWLCDGYYRLRVFDGARWRSDQPFVVAGKGLRVVVFDP